ncbi:hypothetical protein OIU78_014524 [Salix suchowensis]|nr:hypothetical protein OIU78_014524 [Salix suchowensis]
MFSHSKPNFTPSAIMSVFIYNLSHFPVTSRFASL